MAANKYNCTNGERVSQATIEARRSKTYRKLYEGEPHPTCIECGVPAQGSAHIVPQAVVKAEGRAEYCWEPINIVPACHQCNSLMESYKSEEFKELRCLQQILQVTKKISPQRYLLILQALEQ